MQILVGKEIETLRHMTVGPYIHDAQLGADINARDADGFALVEGHLYEAISLANYPCEIPYRSLTPEPSECRPLPVPVGLSA